MLSKCLQSLKTKNTALFLLLIIFHCVPVSAVISIEDSCFKDNKYFILRYFSAQSQPQELENFFDCIDNTIQLFLNHTRTENPNYYKQVELRRFIQYMNAEKTKDKAIAMSQAMLNLKTGLLGGHKNQLSLTEIAICRNILSILRQRMRAMHSIIPVLVQTLNEENIPRQQLINTTHAIRTNLRSLGTQLSGISFSSQLSLLDQLPQNIKTLGFSNENMKNWKPSLLLLSQWKKMFLNSPRHIVHNTEWPVLLDSFGKLVALWFYHKRFLEGRPWMDTRVIQHTQYFLSHSLNFVRDAQRQSEKKIIHLHDIDELARRIWFLPYISQPVFRLGLRSAFCFLLNPLIKNQTCKHNMNFKGSDLKISFSDITFTVKDTNEISESISQNTSDRIETTYLEVLRQYFNSWIKTENQLRQTSQLPPLFGSPHKWLNRKLSITSDRRLLFYKNKTDKVPFLSHLNWQSHLMQLVVSAYTQRGKKQVNRSLWNTMIKEWTAFSVSVYKDMKWQNFQKLGFQIFKHGDFLTTHSNGDRILQKEEILELFSLFTSSLSTVTSSLTIMQDCKSSNPYQLHAPCFWNHLQDLPTEIFTGFPLYLDTLSESEEKKTNYFSTLSSFYSTKEKLSLKDLFEIFLFIHYQENTMEYLDKDFSQYLSTRELEPLLNIFEQTIIDDIPLIYSKQESFAFITYLFHYGEVPIFSKKISSPLHFSNWLLQPEKWQLQVDRKDILHTLFLMNQKLN